MLLFYFFIPIKAREAGQALLEEVDSLTARITAGHAPSLPAALRLSKEVGLLTDVRMHATPFFLYDAPAVFPSIPSNV